MRALTLTALGSIDNLRVQEVANPRLAAADEVLIRVHAAALNHLDLFVVAGLPGVSYDFPHVMGADGAGVVEAAGPEVRGFNPGDRVMINPGLSCWACEYCLRGDQSLCPDFRLLGEHVSGTIAEYVVVPARNLAPVPAQMPWDRAAALSLSGLTAWRMLATRAALRAGETVLIWGIGGGVALAALQIAKHLGARVIATSSSDQKLAAAKLLGADITLNHTTVDIPKEIRALTARRGVDVVVDNVGERSWPQSLRCLGRLGRLVTCGATTGPMCVTDVRKLFWYQWTILGSTMGNYAEYQQLTGLVAQGNLWPVVDQVIPLADARRGIELIQSGAQMGKIVIEVAK